MKSPEIEDKEESPVKEASWEEFRESGLLWWINSALHLFGWCIVFDYTVEGKLKRVFPARTTYRGFPGNSNDKGYKKLTNYMVQNSEQLLKAFPKEEDKE